MTWRTVHIKESEYIRLKLDNLEISKQGNIFYIPLSDISVIILEGNHTTITTKLLSRLSKYNILVVICDDRYMPTGMYYSYGNFHRTAKRAQQQAAWEKRLKADIWKQVVKQKIRNQIDFMSSIIKDSERIHIMEEMYRQVRAGDETNREGHAAKLYFNALYGLDFTREKTCIENIAMNFGYSIIRSAMARMAAGQGLLLMLGVFHRNEYNAFNLVDDLMEPFRPLMDHWIHRVVLGKEEYLSYESRLEIIDFMNQPMEYKGKRSTVDQVMQKYVKSFVTAMEEGKVELLHPVSINDLVREN